MKPTVRIIPWIILAIPFAVLGIFYTSIGNEVLVMRSFDRSSEMFAPKSLFTVFRVPLIEVICAAAIETIRPKFSNSESKPNYFSMWNILLYTIAFKSLFQVFEFISSSVYSSQPQVDFFFYVTLATVIGGICLVIITGRKFFFDVRREDWKLSRARKIFLRFLFIAYLVLAFLPMLIFKSARMYEMVFTNSFEFCCFRLDCAFLRLSYQSLYSF